MAPISFVYEGIESKFRLWVPCKHNKHWGITFEGISKSVFTFFMSFVYLYKVGLITPY